MAVIDVDTHWEFDFRNGDDPLAQWNDRFPPQRVERLAHAIAGDLLDALSVNRRPDGPTLLPSMVRSATERGAPVAIHPQHSADATERIAWMDTIGIDHCLVNPGGYFQSLEYIPEHRTTAARRCNDFLSEQLAGHADRLHGVALVDLSDPDATVVELEHARARGHRAFYLYTVNGRPPASTPPGHPDWDRFWSAVTRLGMVAVIHIGNTLADFSGWADIGWDRPGGAGVSGLTRLANTQRTHTAQNLLVSMLFGGTFHRHPDLTVILEEMRIGWVPPFVKQYSRQSDSSFILGDWPFDASGEQMLRRNVKFTPLPGFGDADWFDVVSALPDMSLFSSDYPHLEGNADPINLYGGQLQALDPAAREAFMGATAADLFTRLGDPL
jgi:predicted TIM-barrel fold metal-dependent hydrolase